MNESNIIQLFISSSKQHADSLALVHSDKAINYNDLYAQVKQTANAYSKKGIQKGDKVLVFVPMCIDLYRIVLALFYIGACPVFLDEWVSIGRLKKCCEVVPCKALIAGNKLLFLSFFIKQLRQIPVKLTPAATGINGDMAPAVVNGDDTALVTFTTGTTGIPKAANRTHAFLHAQYEALVPLLNNYCTPSLVLLPIVVLINLGLGKTTILPPKGFIAKKPGTIPILAGAITKNATEEIVGSPAVVHHLSKQPLHNSHIKRIITGGGAVFPDIADAIVTAFPGASCTVAYGSTEAEPISHMDMRLLPGVPFMQLLTTGLPVGTIDSAISIAVIPFEDKPIPAIDKNAFQKLQLPDGTIGEIVVTGGHVLKSYINNTAAEARQKIHVAGQTWHRTGDAGSLGENGQVYFWGACKEIIHFDNKVYYPLISCFVFKQLTGVKQAALTLANNQLILAIEADHRLSAAMLEPALSQLSLNDARLVYIDHIPTDPRHHTKIDYDSLRKKMGC